MPGLRRVALTTTAVGVAALLALPPALAAPAGAGGTAESSTAPSSQVAAAAPAAEPAGPEPRAVGRWEVEPTGEGTYAVRWISPTPLPTTDARPEFVQDGTVVGVPQLSADGRRLTLEVSADSAPDPTTLDVLLSGVALDAPAGAAAPGGRATYGAVPDLRTLAVDPGTAGSRRIETDDYRLAGVQLGGFPAKTEMVGHVVQPRNAGPTSPLVLFLHGRHSYCYGKATGHQGREWPCPDGMRPIPSQLGYEYAQERLARQGFVTVSIAANGINAQDWRATDGGAQARATLIRRHLQQWVQWSQSATPRFVADLSRVVLVGHSRGGEGANQASLRNRAGDAFHIVGQVLIGPTDFGRRTAPYVPTVTVLPYCDGDVSDLQGQIFTDTARDMTTDDTALHSSVLVMGANHNFFNTEWTPSLSEAPSWDDWYGDPDATCGTDTDARLTPTEQQAVGRAYIAGAVRLMARGDTAMLPLYDGSHVTPASVGDADIRTHVVGAGRDLRRMGSQAGVVPGSTAQTRLCWGRTADAGAAEACGAGVDPVRAPDWTPAFPRGLRAVRNLEVTWGASGEWGGISLRGPALDLSGAGGLDLRTIVDPSLGNVRLDVRLHDANGDSTTVTPEQDGLLPALPGGGYSLAKRWAQTLRVPLGGVTGVDLTRITRVDLVGASADGRVWVLDLAPTRADLPTPPAKRIATVSLGDVTVEEGDGPAPRVVEVPYTVLGPITPGAEILVTVDDWTRPRGYPPQRVAITARTGTIPIEVEADTVDDEARHRFPVVVYPWTGIQTGDYWAKVVVLDDDPTPRVTLDTSSRHVSEGGTAGWRVRLAAPVDYYAGVTAEFVRGSERFRPVRVGDLRKRWVERYLGEQPARRPLYKVRSMLYETIRPGRVSAEFAVPVRRDARDEGREVIALRVRFDRDLVGRAGVVVSEPDLLQAPPG